MLISRQQRVAWTWAVVKMCQMFLKNVTSAQGRIVHSETHLTIPMSTCAKYILNIFIKKNFLIVSVEFTAPYHLVCTINTFLKLKCRVLIWSKEKTFQERIALSLLFWLREVCSPFPRHG